LALGEPSFWDGLIVSVAPVTYTPTATTTSLGTGSLAAPAVEIGRFWNSGTVQTATINLSPAVVGNCSANATWRLIFTWKNDTSGGSSPAGAIDNISLTSAPSSSPITSAGGFFTIDNTLPTSGSNFASFTDAINALNNGGGCGFLAPVIFDVSAGQSFNETPPAIAVGGTAISAIVFQKAGAGNNPVITPAGTAGTNDGGIVISGGDYITFDGIDINTSADATVEYGFIIRNGSATDGAQFNVIKNSAITMTRAITTGTSTSAGIIQTASTTAGGVTPTAISGSNSDNKYYNLTISNAINGIYLNGNTTYRDANTEIGSEGGCTFRNSITNLGPTASTFVSSRGIYATGQENYKIFNNDVNSVAGKQGTSGGIYVLNAFGSDNQIYNNKVTDVSNTGSTTTTSVAYGIYATMSTTTTTSIGGTNSTKVYNNSVANVYTSYNSTASTTERAVGLYVGTGPATGGYDVDNNSVSIGEGLTPTYSNASFQNGGSTCAYNVRNNIFANYTGAQTTARHSAWRTSSASSIGSASLSDFNNLYVANDLGTSGFTAVTSTTTRTTIADFDNGITTPASNDVNSIALDPQFINNLADLHPGNLALNNAGTTPQLYVAEDLDCAIRTDNDQGAYILNACSGTPIVGTIDGPNQLCDGQNVTLTLNGAASDAGISYQWASSATPGGPYTAMGTLNSQATGTLSANTYYVMTSTCSVSGLSATTPEFGININTLPNVAVTPNTGLICLPSGSPVTLTATSPTATTFAWSPSSGLSSTTGVSVDANPTASATYTVSGTDANGCVGTATATITVANNPVINAISATPSTICVGGNSQLEASLTPSPVNAYVFSSGSGTTLDPMAGATQLIGSSVDDTPTAAPTNIGFSFNFNGSAYSQFSVSPDGWILLGGANASSDFSNQVTDPTNIPKIYPYWDDLATGSTGNVSYVVSGTAPNRILIVQWFVTVPRSTSGPANSTFQTWMYESDGKIEFRYGTMGSGTMSSSVGLTGSVANYNSVTIASNSASTSSPNDANLVQPANGTIYTFQPESGAFAWSPSTYLNATNISNPVANNVLGNITYDLTVTTPSGCSSTASVSIETEAVNVALSPVNVTCNGGNDGSFTLDAVNCGLAPFEYSVDGGAFGAIPTDLVAGTYSVVVKDATAATGSAITVVVTEPSTVIGTPTSNGNAIICAEENSALISASALLSTVTSSTVTFNLGTNVAVGGSATVNSSVTATLPAGATVTGTELVFTNVSTAGGNWPSDMDVSLSGASTLAPVVMAPVNSSVTNAGPYTINSSLLNGNGGVVNFTLLNNYIGTATIGSIDIIVTYTTPNAADIAWFDANTGGNLLGTTSSLETVGTSVLPNTNTAGTYTFYAAGREGSCYSLNRIPITVTVNALPTVDAGADQTVCFGDTVTFSASGAVSYAWDNNVTDGVEFIANATLNLTATGTDANGCSNTDVAVLNVNALPLVNAGNDLTVCQNGQASVQASGASSYVWSNGIQNNIPFAVPATVTLTVTGTDANGCVNSDDVTITASPLPTVDAGANIVQCGDQSVTLSATGATYYTWNNGVQNDVAFDSPFGTTSYIVTGVDTLGCSGSDVVNVTINQIPVASATAADAITLVATPANASYQWINCSDNSPIIGATNSTFTASANGNYAVIVTVNGDCSDTSDCVVIDQVGLTDLGQEIGLQLYPNPTMDNFYVSFLNIETISLRILDMQGKLIVDNQIIQSGQKLDVSPFERGVYSIEFTTDNGQVITRRLIKN
jgi:hypothetical protein